MPAQECECGAKYRFPESAVGKRAKCKQCGAVFTLKAEADQGPIPLSGDSGVMDELCAADEQTTRGRAACGDLPPVPAAYLPNAESRGRLGPAVIEEAAEQVSYARSLMDTFLFPFSMQNFMTYVFISGLLFVSYALLSVIGCIGLAPRIIVLGWYCAFRFSVIESASAGERALPSITMEHGPVDDIVVPILKWFGSWVLLAPAYLGVLLAFYFGSWSSPMPNPIPAMLGGVVGILSYPNLGTAALPIIVYVAIVTWPIIVLCVVLGGFGTLWRLDLIIWTLIKTLPSYAITAAIVLGADMARLLLYDLRPDWSAGDVANYFARHMIVAGSFVYCEIVAARVIGLYYYHFKHRFAWSWE